LVHDYHSQLIKNPRTLNRICVLSLLLFSLFFAFYHSNSAYTSDEVWSIKAASLDYQSEMEVLKADVHPPLYYQILHFWIRIFGRGERAVRILSALFYILSVVAVYGLGRELYGDRAALICAAIYLASPLTILASQFARMYSLLSLLSILSTWLYLQFSRKHSKHWLLAVTFVIANVLGTFTHIAFFFILFAEIIFHLIVRRRAIKVFLLVMACSVLPYIVFWAPVLLRQVNQSKEGLAWVPKPSLTTIVELFMLYGGAFWLLVPALIYVWWRTGLQPFRVFSTLDRKALPLWMLTITLLTPLLTSLVKPIFNARLAIIGVHLFALTAAAVIGRRATCGSALGLASLTLVGLFFLHPSSAPCDNRAVASYLSQMTNDGDVVIFTGLTRLPIDFYLRQVGGGRKLTETSFPAEIDKHPGYEGRITDPSRKNSNEREAQALVNMLTQMRSGNEGLRIFVFRGLHGEIDSMIDEALRKHFTPIPDQRFKCVESSPYFNEISVYR
jgi:Dolichyl-phosphate-mannose-protein mannosyltransferase